ncbi:hypothetical protein FOMPIDRAFT_23495, partial [Fomitopsis schrenkii]
MRALVSLYQQSDHFLTPSNLSETIDKEFVVKFAMGTGDSRGEELDYRDLREQQSKLEASPKIGDLRVAADTSAVAVPTLEPAGNWSGSRNSRETRVLRALYGLEVGRRPGLEVLEEERERVRKQI